MILKYALTDCKPIQFSKPDDTGMIRLASGSMTIEPGSEKERIIKAEIKKHPDALFFRAKAIEANKANNNGDYFSEEELIKACKTFEGKPFFTNHDNQNIENAKGKIVFAEWNDETKAIYVVAFVDRQAYPHICRSIEEQYVSGTSMGCSVDYSECSICHNIAERTEDYCTHIRNRKGRKFTGKARDVKTGETKEFKDADVFEYNYGIKFIELSAVVDPACPSCTIQNIISNDDYLKKVANIENTLRMVKTSALEKNASQEEIQQIEQVLQTLEQISISLIQNRQQVEVEFASDLVNILSQLQEWLDELIGAGYGNIQNQDQVPGTIGNVPEIPDAGIGQENAGAAMPGGDLGAAATPVAAEAPLGGGFGGVGSVSGQPGKPMVNSPGTPQLPITAPMRPNASDSRTIQRISDQAILPPERRIESGQQLLRAASEMCKKMKITGDDNMAQRRTAKVIEAQKEHTKQVLSESWQEKQHFIEYIEKVPSLQDNHHKLSVKNRDGTFIIVAEKKDGSDSKVWTYEDLDEKQRRLIVEQPRMAATQLLKQFVSSQNQEGDTRMAEQTKREAGANSVNATPEVITERQLEEKRDLYHAREDEDKHEITQAQLEAKRKGEKDYLTEKQLDDAELKQHPRTEATPEVITEAQMDGDNRKNEDKHEITQAQLDTEGNRVNNEPDQITERQLDNISAPWARVATRDPAKFVSASDHMKAVVSACADTCIETGATPKELQRVASGLVDGTRARYQFSVNLLEEREENASFNPVKFAQRASFWAARNVKIAATHPNEVEECLINNLRTIVAETTINPDVIVDAIDVISEDETGLTSITNEIDARLNDTTEVEANTSNRKQELRIALSPKVKEQTANNSTKEERDAKREELLAKANKARQTRSAEREEWETMLRDNMMNPKAEGDTVIETSLEEMGTNKESKTFKQDIYHFAKGALAAKNVKVSSITNVTIDPDGTVQIALNTSDTASEESVEFEDEGTLEIPPVGEEFGPETEEVVPEGDLTGEALEETIPAPEAGVPGAQGGGIPGLPPTPTPGAAMASNKGKMTRVAQSPMGGGIPQTPGGVSAPGAPEQNIPDTMPQNDPVQSLMSAEPGEDIPTVGERQPAWTICPECGSSDVDIESEDNGEFHGQCNSCSATFDALVKKTIEFTIIKPTKSVGSEGEEGAKAPEGPEEIPALPVAAQTRMDKNTIIRIGKNLKEHGHVCPACGNGHCEPTFEEGGHKKISCEACGTEFVKDVIVSSVNPSESFLRVSWHIFPNLDDCPECREKAIKFASRIRVSKMLKNAEVNAETFPMANCVERLARMYGGETVASFGPCKGKLLANCVCGQLRKLGLTKVRHLEKLAAASMETDDMDVCVEDQVKRGHTQKEAETICGCIKKKFATADDDNIYLKAFADDIDSGVEKMFKKADLGTIMELLDELEQAIQEEVGGEFDDIDIGDELPPLDDVEVDVDVEEIPEEPIDEVEEVSVEVKDLEEEEVVETDETDETDEVDVDEESEGEFDMEDVRNSLASMDGKRIRRSGNESAIKMASKPKQIKTVEKDVEAGVPRAKATMRNENSGNIDVPMATPSVPRAKATMGKEGPDNIDVPAGLPDVAVDSSYMGVEKSIQQGMPAINNEIKGTVIAEADKLMKLYQKAKTANEKAALLAKFAKKMKEIDTVEGDVEAGVPRAKATMGNEGADNIDVPMAKPSVPRSKATMGEEGPDNIDVDAPAPDVPVDNAYMGVEKDVQSDMPGINDEYLKNVQQKRQVQMDRIAAARREEARNTAAWLMASGRIENNKETFESVVTALSSFEIDKIATVADQMFPESKKQTKQASTKSQEAHKTGHSIPGIVLESKETTDPVEDLASRLSKAFTIGNREFDHNLTVYGER